MAGRNEKVELWETKGPQKVRAKFSHISPELVCIKLATNDFDVNVILDTSEFKSFLKAGLRLDERISGSLVKLTPGELDPRD